MTMKQKQAKMIWEKRVKLERTVLLGSQDFVRP